MPHGDRKGPEGLGPLTGRRQGYCSGFSGPGFMSRGRGLGQGFGRGRRNMYHATGLPGWAIGGPSRNWPYQPNAWPMQPAPTAQDEIEMLKNQSVYYKETLEEIEQRLAELTESAKKKND